MIRWQRYLSEPDAREQRAVSAILPLLPEWLGRGWGGVTYGTAQVLTGHGCFGRYLCRIKKERTTQCHHCSGDQDSAQHTLEECPSWAERRALVQSIGRDLSLPAVIAAILRKEENWKAFSSFCESVMSQKEKAERVRRGELRPPAREGGEVQIRGRARRRLRRP